MKTALVQLAEDFLTSFVFLGLFLALGNLPLAVGAAIAVGIAQFAIARWRQRRFDVMQWLSLGLVVLLGGATLFTADSRFMMAKPTAIHFAIGAVMLRPGWLERYMPPMVKEHVPENILVACGYIWAALVFTVGLCNLYIAAFYSPVVWGWFITVGATGAKVVVFLVQYTIFQIIIRRNLSQVAQTKRT